MGRRKTQIGRSERTTRHLRCARRDDTRMLIRSASAMLCNVTTPANPGGSSRRRPCASDWSKIETNRFNSSSYTEDHEKPHESLNRRECKCTGSLPELHTAFGAPLLRRSTVGDIPCGNSYSEPSLSRTTRNIRWLPRLPCQSTCRNPKCPFHLSVNPSCSACALKHPNQPQRYALLCFSAFLFFHKRIKRGFVLGLELIYFYRQIPCCFAGTLFLSWGFLKCSFLKLGRARISLMRITFLDNALRWPFLSRIWISYHVRPENFMVSRPSVQSPHRQHVDTSNCCHKCTWFQTCNHDTREDVENHTTIFYILSPRDYDSSRRAGLWTCRAFHDSLSFSRR